MRFAHTFALASALATTVQGGLVAIRPLPVSTNTNLDLYPIHHERQLFAGLSLGSFDLATSKQNSVLFDLTDNEVFGSGAASVGLKVTCVDCRTWGSAIISTTGAEKDNDFFGDIVEFFQDPEKSILDAIAVDLKLELSNVGGHFEFDILALGALSYSIPLFQSLTPVGAAIGDGISIGIVLSVELTFSLTAEINLNAGFDFSFPENTFITVNPLTGEIKEDGFLDGEIDPLEITVTSGLATFKAALKVKLQAGTTVELFGTGFDFQLGVFANVIEYVATISNSEKCDLLITELLDVNIGAFAEAVVSFAFITIGGSAPVVTTILTIPLPTLCIALGDEPVATTIPLITAGSSFISITTSAASAIVTPPGGHLVGKPFGTGVPYFPANSTYTPPTSTTIFTTSIRHVTHQPTPASPSTYPSANTTVIHPIGKNNTQLITTTIYATTTISLYACASPVINCPTSLASEVIITSTNILYSTICTPGAILPTTLPDGKAPYTPIPAPIKVTKSKNANTGTRTSLHLIHLATPITEVIYTPTFNRVIYTMPAEVSAAIASASASASAAAVSGGGGGGAEGNVDVGDLRIKGVKGTYATSSTAGVESGTGIVTVEALAAVTAAGTTTGSAEGAIFTGAASSMRVNGCGLGMVVGVLIGFVIVF